MNNNNYPPRPPNTPPPPPFPPNQPLRGVGAPPPLNSYRPDKYCNYSISYPYGVYGPYGKYGAGGKYGPYPSSYYFPRSSGRAEPYFDEVVVVERMEIPREGFFSRNFNYIALGGFLGLLWYNVKRYRIYREQVYFEKLQEQEFFEDQIRHTHDATYRALETFKPYNIIVDPSGEYDGVVIYPW